MSPESEGNESEVRRESFIIHHLPLTITSDSFPSDYLTNLLILKIFLPTLLFVLFFFLPLHSRSTNAVFYSERGWQNFPNLFKTHKMHVKQVLNRGKLDFCVRTGID